MPATTVDQLLDSPLKKIAWARQRHRELRAEIASYLARSPYRMVGREDRNLGELKFSLDQIEPMPDAISLAAGDAIHAARAALDHLAWALVGDIAAKPKGVTFPMLRGLPDRKSAEAARSKAQLGLVTDAVFDEILAQAETDDGELVGQLHDLDISDKHRLLILARGSFQTTFDALGHPMVKGAAPIRLVGRDSAIKIAIPKAPRAERRRGVVPIREFPCPFAVNIEIIFDDREVAYPHPVVEHVQAMTDAAENVIRAVASRAF